MANVYRKGLLVCDTVAAACTVTIQVCIAKIRWVGVSSPGHVATITDAAGNVFWTSVASGSNYAESDDFSQRDQSKRTLAGITISALSSGTLYIYTE